MSSDFKTKFYKLAKNRMAKIINLKNKAIHMAWSHRLKHPANWASDDPNVSLLNYVDDPQTGVAFTEGKKHRTNSKSRSKVRWKVNRWKQRNSELLVQTTRAVRFRTNRIAIDCDHSADGAKEVDTNSLSLAYGLGGNHRTETVWRMVPMFFFRKKHSVKKLCLISNTIWAMQTKRQLEWAIMLQKN